MCDIFPLTMILIIYSPLSGTVFSGDYVERLVSVFSGESLRGGDTNIPVDS